MKATFSGFHSERGGKSLAGMGAFLIAE